MTARAAARAPRRRRVSARLPDPVRLVVPPLDPEPWPSLGGHVCRFIEENLVHGPGDVLGHPAELTDEFRAFIWRAYEVHPRNGPAERAGRRRFKRVGLFRRKGAAKTELGAWISIAELDPDGPVRTVGWRQASSDDVDEGYARGSWVPVGGGIRDPYIPLMATTEEQAEDLGYSAVREILLDEHCELGQHYDIGLGRITRRDAPGVLQALAGSPNARDGARTTFQWFDEPHLMISDRLKSSHATMLRNIPKRKIADAWTLYTSTMYEPGELSVAELLHLLALDIMQGAVEDSAVYFDHLQASLLHDLSRRPQLIRAIEEASGDALEFADVAAIAQQYLEANSDRQAFRRYWLNQPTKGERKFFPTGLFEPLVHPRRRPKPGRQVVLAFDGSYARDSTALVGCTVELKPHVFVVKAWERPRSKAGDGWRTPRLEVDAAVADAMETWEVVELAPDPPGWHREIEEWEQTYGEPPVVRFETNQISHMGPAADQFLQGAKEHDFTVDGDPALMRHFDNCVKADRRGYTVPTKSAADSPDKIDLAIGAIVSHVRARHHFTAQPARPRSWRAH